MSMEINGKTANQTSSYSSSAAVDQVAYSRVSKGEADSGTV